MTATENPEMDAAPTASRSRDSLALAEVPPGEIHAKRYAATEENLASCLVTTGTLLMEMGKQ